ncbi:MAG: aldolase [Deltaproteobacteria bacterium]|nr:aldolase [Deltaproteobacteria bacterium]
MGEAASAWAPLRSRETWPSSSRRCKSSASDETVKTSKGIRLSTRSDPRRTRLAGGVVSAGESRLREDIVLAARSLYDRGLTHGSTGNISARVDDGWLLTPTGSNLGRLDPARLSKLDWNGRLLAGDPPSKEMQLHLAVYQERSESGAVVHLHATHSVAVSILPDRDPDDVMPPLTAYYVMRIGTLPMIPYFAPGDAALAEAVRVVARRHHAVLLANHGPVVGGKSLDAACDAIEELEATARLFLLVRQEAKPLRVLTADQVADLQRRFPR